MEKITMTVAELATLMGLSKPKAYELAAQQGFPCIQVGRRRIIPVNAFKRWMDEQTSGGEANDSGNSK